MLFRSQDNEFKEQNRTYYGYTARIIQHEFEHTQGKLYIDRLSPLRKQLIKNKLMRIIKGNRKKVTAFLYHNKKMPDKQVYFALSI